MTLPKQEIVNELLEVARLKAKEYEKKADLFRSAIIEENEKATDKVRFENIANEKEASMLTEELNDEEEGSVEGDLEPEQEVEE